MFEIFSLFKFGKLPKVLTLYVMWRINGKLELLLGLRMKQKNYPELRLLINILKWFIRPSQEISATKSLIIERNADVVVPLAKGEYLYIMEKALV